jgi:hypothetical protein
MTQIVLEGPDNSGKSTLARALLDVAPSYHYYHPGGPPADEVEEDQFISNQILMAHAKTPILFDRITPVSQLVYAPRPERQAVRVGAVSEILNTSVLVYCRPSTDCLMRFEKFTWREGESEAHKQLIIRNQLTYVQRYDQTMEGFSHVTYDFEDEPAAKALEVALMALMRGDREIIDMYLSAWRRAR